jgi:hypothetical protein
MRLYWFNLNLSRLLYKDAWVIGFHEEEPKFQQTISLSRKLTVFLPCSSAETLSTKISLFHHAFRTPSKLN